MILPNDTMIMDILKNNMETFSVVCIDIDYTIRFSRKFSSQEMDTIMYRFLAFFDNEFPKASLIVKSEGDEFLIYIPDMGKSEVKDYTNGVRKSFKKIKFAAGLNQMFSNVTFSFSAGVATYPNDGGTYEEIKRKAMTCLLLAKAFRRNRVFDMPEDIKGAKDRILAVPDGCIEVLLGQYGEIGHISDPVSYDAARLWEPQAIDTDDDGNLYIVDQNNHGIIKCNGYTAARIAGDGNYGYSGDSGNAKTAKLNKPTGLAVHGRHLYITDTGNDVVRIVDLDTGIIETAAGCGDTGHTGDKGKAISAKLDKPGGVAVDHKGNLYINDIANNVIRKVDDQNIITTFAGNGQYGYTGDGEIAVNASFAEIYGICMDKKDYRYLYLADYFNHCIRAVDLESGIIKTIAGSTTPGYSGDGNDPLKACLMRPVAICSDMYGNLFIAESGNHCVRVISAHTGTIMTIAGDGIYGIGGGDDISKFRFANPNGLAVDNNGYLYILDGANNRVCMFDYSKLI